jgi:tetratricopeptide (TPR) repeat protein
VVASATPQKLAALERFGDGDRVGAWPILAELTQASVRARTAAANATSAAEVRQLAEQRDVMRINGEATATDVLALWDQSAVLDPTDFWTHIYRGRLAATVGQLTRADSAIRRAVQVSRTDRDRAVAQSDLGTVLTTQGDLAGARSRYDESLAIHRRLAAADPANAQAQRDLSVSLNKLGDVLTTQGDLAGARARYDESLVLRRRHAAADPANAQAQRDLSISLERLGTVLTTQGDLAGARARYDESLAIHRRLAAADPANAQAQRDLSVSLEKVGTVLTTQGDLAGARAR